MSGKIIKVAVAILVRRDGKILMGKRLNAAGAGTWGLPGGHLEFGEKISDAAHRELFEETGLKADPKLINITNHVRSDQHYVHFGYEASNIQGEPTVTEPDKCESWEWFDPNDLPQPIFFGQEKVLAAMLNNEPFTE